MVHNSRTLDGQSDKLNPQDFALWKKADEKHIMRWSSPWSDGFPGWHLECSAMSKKFLGNEFDIHGGGHDLRFPHHEAEIFQGECHTGVSPVVHYWMHNGFVNMDGEKMSKSLGNFWTIRDILSKVDALVLRFALINAHYRSPIDMNQQLLDDAQKNHDRLVAVYSDQLAKMSDDPGNLPTGQVGSPIPLVHTLGLLEKMAEGFAKAMDDDFNSREAVAKILGMVREIGKLELSGEDVASFATYAVELLEELAGDVLGVLPSRVEALAEPEEDPRRAAISEQVESLLIQRADARLSKDWDAADRIRDELNAMGVEVTDTADGPEWSLL